MRRLSGGAAALALLAAAAPGHAAERNFGVTGFERLRVEGPYDVTVTTGVPPMVHASGDIHALDALEVEVRDRTLVIRGKASWGDDSRAAANGPVRIAIATHELSGAAMVGSGSMAVDAMRGMRTSLALVGSGRLRLGAVAGDRLDIAVEGAGTLGVAGKVANVRAALRGGGGIAAPKLVAEDAEIVSTGSGDITLAATRTAHVVASGTTSVAVAGDPACTVSSAGSAAVRCGRRGK